MKKWLRFHIVVFMVTSVVFFIAFRLIDNNCAFVSALPGIFDELEDFYSVMIGIYIAILVLLSTSHTPISTLLHQKGLVLDFQNVITASIIYGGIFVVSNIFWILENQWRRVFLSTIGLLELLYMIYFVVIVIYMFIYNMQKLEEDSSKQNKKIENFITLVEEIEKNTRK